MSGDIRGDGPEPTADGPTRSDSFVSLILVSFNRADELEAALQSAAGRGFGEIVVLDNGSEPPLEPLQGATKWIRSDVNLGATGGRNLAAESATGDVICFIDSDAILLAPQDAKDLTTAFDSNPNMGILAGLTVRAGGVILDEEFPFRSVDEPGLARPAPYFLECAVAVRRSAWKATCGYDPRYRIYHEAIDLAMRTWKAGWEVWFDPALCVEHRPATSGRTAGATALTLRLRNRVLYCRRHLPLAIAAIHLTIWATHVAFRAGWSNRRVVVDGLLQGVRERIEREPISYRQAWKLHRTGWRVFW